DRTLGPGFPPWGGLQPPDDAPRAARGRNGARPGDVVASGVARPVHTPPLSSRVGGGLRMGLCPKMPTEDCAAAQHRLAARKTGVSRERSPLADCPTPGPPRRG